MTGDSDGSLADTPESQRYLSVLEGSSITGAKISHGAAARKDTAARVLNRFKDKRSRAKQDAADRRAIESGQVKDIQ